MVYDITFVKESYTDPVGYAVKCFESSIDEAFDLYNILQEADEEVGEKKKSFIKRIIEAITKFFERMKKVIAEKYNQIKEKIMTIRNKIRKKKEEDPESFKGKSDEDCLQKVLDADIDAYIGGVGSFSGWDIYKGESIDEILNDLKLDGDSRDTMLKFMFNSCVTGSKDPRECIPSQEKLKEEYDKVVDYICKYENNDGEIDQEHIHTISNMYEASVIAIRRDEEAYDKVLSIVNNYYT